MTCQSHLTLSLCGRDLAVFDIKWHVSPSVLLRDVVSDGVRCIVQYFLYSNNDRSIMLDIYGKPVNTNSW